MRKGIHNLTNELEKKYKQKQALLKETKKSWLELSKLSDAQLTIKNINETSKNYESDPLYKKLGPDHPLSKKIENRAITEKEYNHALQTSEQKQLALKTKSTAIVKHRVSEKYAKSLVASGVTEKDVTELVEISKNHNTNIYHIVPLLKNGRSVKEIALFYDIREMVPTSITTIEKVYDELGGDSEETGLFMEFLEDRWEELGNLFSSKDQISYFLPNKIVKRFLNVYKSIGGRDLELSYEIITRGFDSVIQDFMPGYVKENELLKPI